MNLEQVNLHRIAGLNLQELFPVLVMSSVPEFIRTFSSVSAQGRLDFPTDGRMKVARFDPSFK